MPHDRSVETDSSHERKVTADVVRLIDRETEVNPSRITTRSNYYRFLFVQRQTKLTRKHVRGSARNDPETRFRSSHTLNDFVDGPIAAGDNDLRRSIPRGARCDRRCVMRRGGRSQIDLNTMRSKKRSDVLDGNTARVIASGPGV